MRTSRSLGLQPVLPGDTCLPQESLEQVHADVTDMWIRDCELMFALDHVRMAAAPDRAGPAQLPEASDQVLS